jgi:ABC-type Fe3+/spermidine/putrescine transport system ATPase subunit
VLDIKNLVVAYGKKTVLHGVDLTIAEGEIICLLGPSGCGKTTLLRTIAGLEQAQKGDIQIDGQSILNIPVHQRGFGLMFQDFALFPHLNVIQNVTFGLKMQGLATGQRETLAEQALSLVGLDGFQTRDVGHLSGGEKQRVALARSLAPSPRLLMLDEPLGSLDAALRGHLALELRDIIKRVGLTAIYVTHDQQEAFAIADRVIVMNRGQIEQDSPPEQIYQQPETVFTAQFLGLDNIVSGVVAHQLLGADPSIEADGYYLLHPDLLRWVSDNLAENVFEGEVIERVFMGRYYRLRVRIDGETTLTINATSNHTIPIIGQRVGLQLGGGIIRLSAIA